jgi:ABC-type sulfate transport system permease component
VVDLSGFGPLRTIVFDNTAATGAGYAYGEMTYTLVDAVVPLPATLPMLLAGAGALVLAGRRRRG